MSLLKQIPTGTRFGRLVTPVVEIIAYDLRKG